MSIVQRLRLVGVTLALTGVVTCAQVWGDVASARRPLQSAGRKDGAPGELKAGESFAAAKFAEQPVVAYRKATGEIVFGAQVRPDLGAPVAQPRDIPVLIDNSASQAGPSYTLARQITKALSDGLKADDQIAVWTVNIPSATRDRSGGF